MAQMTLRTVGPTLVRGSREGAARPDVRVLHRSTWIPPPVQRLIEPYLPPPPLKTRQTAPGIHSPTQLPTNAIPAPSRSSTSRKVYVRRGVLREANTPLAHLPTTSSGIRAKLRYSLSVGDAESALRSAVEVLDDQLVAPSTSDMALQRKTRSELYNLVIHQFLNRPNMANLGAAYKLFERQHAEGLPIDAKVLTVYIRAVLDNPFSADSPMVSLAAVFPFLPETYDIRLLTLILRATVRHVRPPPEEVQEMIRASIPRKKDEPPAVMQNWDLDLWDVYMGSLLAHGQLKEAVRMLKHFQTAVWTQQAQGLRSAEDASKSNTAPVAIARAYISLLVHWVESGFPSQHQSHSRTPDVTRRKSGSTTPRAIASHCFETLRGAAPPVELLNAWLAAETAGGNQERAERLWEVISGLDLSGRALETEVAESQAYRWRVLETINNPNWQTGSAMSTQLPADLRPDASTYTAVFKLLKRLSYPPSRQLLRCFLSNPRNTDAKSLNSALSTLFSVGISASALPTSKAGPRLPDLAAALVMLQQFHPLKGPTDIAPLPRTLDIVAAGLIRLSRQGMQVFEDSGPQERVNHALRHGGSADLAVGGGIGQRVTLREWDRISQELHNLRDIEDTDHGVAVMLPVGYPFARLVDEHTAYHAYPSPTPTETPSHTISRQFYPNPGGRSTAARQLLPALEKMLRRAIAAQLSSEGITEVGEEKVEQVIDEARDALRLSGPAGPV